MAFTASQAFDLLRTAFSRNRLPHALLIVGDEHQGASRLILQLLELMNGIRADHLDGVRVLPPGAPQVQVAPHPAG